MSWREFLLTDQKILRSILWSSVERMVLRHCYCPYSWVFLREATPTSSLCFGQLIGPIRPYMERLVLSSEVDIALVTGRPTSSNLIVEPYRKEELIAFVARNHPLASKRELSLSDFARVPLVIHGRKNSSNTVVSILQDLKRKGVEPVVAVRSESPDAVKTAVREKIGMGILYQDVLRRDLGRGEFISVKLSGLKLEAESFVIWHSDKPLSSAALGFLRLLRWWRTKQLEKVRDPKVVPDKRVFLEERLSQLRIQP
jgi:hypothetical protein